MIVNRIVSVEVDLHSLPFNEWPEEAKRIAYGMSQRSLRSIAQLPVSERKAAVVSYVENRKPLTLAELFGSDC